MEWEILYLKKDSQECLKLKRPNYKSKKDLQEIYLSPKLMNKIAKLVTDED